MADNLGYTPGTGAYVATDDAGAAGHVQVVKLAVSADGSATVLPADGTYGLAVDIKRTVSVVLGAGSAVIGAVTQSGAWSVSISGTPTVTVQDGGGSVSVDDNGGSLTVDGTVAATQSGTWNIGSVATLPALASGSNTIGAVTQASGPWTTVERGATINHAGASVTTTQVSLLSAGTTRRAVVIQNLGTDFVWLGATGITANSGLRLAPGQTVVIDRSPNAQIFAIASSGTQPVAMFWESD